MLFQSQSIRRLFFVFPFEVDADLLSNTFPHVIKKDFPSVSKPRGTDLSQPVQALLSFVYARCTQWMCIISSRGGTIYRPLHRHSPVVLDELPWNVSALVTNVPKLQTLLGCGTRTLHVSTTRRVSLVKAVFSCIRRAHGANLREN